MQREVICVATKTAPGPTAASSDRVVEWVLIGLPVTGSQLDRPMYLYLADGARE